MKFPSNVLEKDSLFNFGKYKGNTIEYILDTDPGYIVWCVETLEWFDINPDIFDEAVNRISFEDSPETIGWFHDYYDNMDIDY